MSIFFTQKELRKNELMTMVKDVIRGKKKTTPPARKPATRAATRDASWYPNPSVYGKDVKYHAVAHKSGVAGCSLFLVMDHMRIDQTVAAESVLPRMRCMRPGCKVLWPAYKPTKKD